MIRTIALSLALGLAPLPVLAHKVIFGVFKSGDAVEGELGFSNGDMAAGATIEVFDTAGQKLGEAVTDADGFFLYTPTEPIAHVFRANLGAGHVGETEMPAEDIADILGMAAVTTAPQTSPAVADTPSQTTVTVASLTDEERTEIAAIVRDEMRPLRREIAAYREKNDLQTILGGMGYILGLFGVGFYLAARRRLKHAA